MALVTGVSVAQAQTTYPNVKVTGRLQEQFYYFGNEDYAATVGPQSNVFTRRARIEARGNISENVVGLHPAVVRGRPEPLERGHHLYLLGRAGRRRYADDHLPHHRPERAPAA